MTDFDYDPIPLTLPERLSAAAMLSSAIAHRDLMSRPRTVRHFSDESVQRAVIEACILAAGLAPSGANHQPWNFVCVNDAMTKRSIREAAAAEERAFYGGKAGDTWIMLIDYGLMPQHRFWRRPPGWLLYSPRGTGWIPRVHVKKITPSRSRWVSQRGF